MTLKTESARLFLIQFSTISAVVTRCGYYTLFPTLKELRGPGHSRQCPGDFFQAQRLSLPITAMADFSRFYPCACWTYTRYAVAVPRLKSPQNPLFAARAFLPDKNQLVQGKRPTLYATVLLGSLPMKSLIFVGKNNRLRLSLSQLFSSFEKRRAFTCY